MTIEQISVFIENTTGSLAKVTSLLGENGVDLKAMSIADTTEFGILRIITSDTEKASELLRQANYAITIAPVLAVGIEDSPSSLAKLLNVLSEAEIAIEYIYAFITRNEAEAHVVLRVEDNETAEQILVANGQKILTKDDIAKL